MTFLIAALLTLVALVCLLFSRTVSTRMLGFAATGTTLVSGGLLFVQRFDFPPAVPPFVWAVISDQVLSIAPRVGVQAAPLVLVLLTGATLAFLTLALTVSSDVRGFGGVFGWSLLSIATAILGLSSSPLLQPFGWATTALLVYAAVRMSGALDQGEALPRGVATGLGASLLLLSALLLLDQATEPFPATPLVLLVLASLIYAGGAPLNLSQYEALRAPAALTALIVGLVLPLLGLGSLLQLFGTIRLPVPELVLPPLLRNILLGLGLLSLAACTGGALRSRRLKALLSWLAGAQAGLVVLALVLEGPAAAIAAPTLLVNLALTTLGGGLAIATLERSTGSDDYTEELQAGVDLRLPGLLWLLVTLSVLGIPSSWGFWGRLWLFEAGLQQMPWIIPPILAVSILQGLVCLGPLVRFWWSARVNKDEAEPRSFATLRAGAGPYLSILLLWCLVLLVLGLAPQAWAVVLQLITGLPTSLPIPLAAQIISGVVAALGVFGLVVLGRKTTRPALKDTDMEPVVLAPDTLAEALEPLAILGRPLPLLQGSWDMLKALCWLARRVIVLFEQRFYLVGVLLALISLVLLMAQG